MQAAGSGAQSLKDKNQALMGEDSDSDSIHKKSIHDINLCIEKIEELSTECKSLLSVIQDLERGDTEFLSEMVHQARISPDGKLPDLQDFIVDTERDNIGGIDSKLKEALLRKDIARDRKSADSLKGKA